MQVAIEYGSDTLRGTATGGDVDLLTDVNSLDAYDDHWFKRAWVYILDTGDLRLIDDSLDGSLAPRRDFSAAITAGTEYFIWTGRPKDALEQAAKDALAAAYPAFYLLATYTSTGLVVTDRQFIYNLPATLPTSADVIKAEISRRPNETPEIWTELAGWEVTGGNFSLAQDGHYPIGASMRLTAMSPIAAPSPLADDASIDVDHRYEQDLLTWIGVYGAMLLSIRAFPRETPQMREHLTQLATLKQERLAAIGRMPMLPGRHVWPPDLLGNPGSYVRGA
jgi:hypothetical protein